MKLKLIPILFLSLLMLNSCDAEDTEEDAKVSFFTLTYRNIGGQCNNTNLNFTFQITRVSDGLQQTHTVGQGETVIGSVLGFNDRGTLNVKVFASSSENPLSEANIEFHYTDYTEAQLRSPNNELHISYCHTEDLANITWRFDI